MEELSPVQFEIKTKLDWEEFGPILLPRIEASAKLELPHLFEVPMHEGRAVIVGAGPSAGLHLDTLSDCVGHPLSCIFSVNGAHNWLRELELTPNIHVLFEHDLDVVETSTGGPTDKQVVYYVASHCSPGVFRGLDGYRSVLWHANIPIQGYHEAIAKHFPGEFMISGGYATFFKTITIAHTLGFRKFEIFGADSSFETNSHLDGYRTSNLEECITVWGIDPRDDTMREFKTHGGLAFQANEFVKFCADYHKDFKLRVHGDNLLRYLHESRYPEQYKS